MWNDRIREAAYTSPSGNRTVFGYENVSKEVEKKTTAFNFPDASGTYIQDLGHTGKQYPLRIFFWGDDYDLQAAAFEQSLLEAGQGKLEHPAYGAVNVVPFGRITQKDDLKTAANQAIIEVTFWETTGVVYPTNQNDSKAQVIGAAEQFNNSTAEQFANTVDLSDTPKKSFFRSAYQNVIGGTKTGLQAIADVQDDVRQQFNNINDSINQSIDVLISQPLDLAFQTTLMVQAPARAAATIQDRLTAYRDLANSLISGDGAVVEPDLNGNNANSFYNDSLFVSSYVVSSVIATVNTQFDTQPDALSAAEELLDLLSDVTDWQDNNYGSLGQVDTGGAYQQMQDTVALAAGFLVDISFTLKQERRITLGRNRTIIDLSAELYGNVDEQLDFLIATNELTGSEILELPAGREVVYYV